MKRLLYSPGFPPMIGGLQSFMLARCRATPDSVDVLAAEEQDSAAFDRTLPFDVERFPYPWEAPRFGPARRLLQLKSAYAVLNRRLAERRYDTVETATVFPGVVAMSLWRAARRPFIVSFAHGDDLLRPLRTGYATPLFRRALATVDRFVANSEYTRDVLVRAGVPSSKIGIVHPPIDLKQFTLRRDPTSVRASLPPHDCVLLTVSRLVYKKRIDRIIALMPELLRDTPGLLYVVAGDGDDGPRLRQLANDRGVSGRVVFLGRVSDEQLPQVYAAADVFVLVTEAAEDRGEVEGFGIVYREAGSQGVPAIGPTTGGSTSAIVDGKTGYLVATDQELLTRIRQLVMHRDLRQSLGAEARALALRPTDWSPLLNPCHA